MRSGLALACWMVLAAGAQAAAPQAGVYSSVTFSPETGDAGGSELELRLDGGAPSIIFATCEGGCWGGEATGVRIEGDGLFFEVTEQWLHSDGSVASREVVRYQARTKGAGMILTSPDRPNLRARLKRLRDPEPGRTAWLTGY